jgi:hypothetical protein
MRMSVPEKTEDSHKEHETTKTGLAMIKYAYEKQETLNYYENRSGDQRDPHCL